MPRKPTEISTVFPYHISARCINREWFDLPLDTVWDLMEDYLYLTAHIFELRIHSFVLMSNHFHLLMSVPKGNLPQAMNYFMRETSREITRLSGRINQTYGSRYHRSLIKSYHHFMNTYKYVYRNPVRAKICNRVEEYKYSTLGRLFGQYKLIIPMVEDGLIFSPNFNEEQLAWLNKSSSPELEEELRKALRRTEFHYRTARGSGRTSVLETHLI